MRAKDIRDLLTAWTNLRARFDNFPPDENQAQIQFESLRDEAERQLGKLPPNLLGWDLISKSEVILGNKWTGLLRAVSGADLTAGAEGSNSLTPWEDSLRSGLELIDKIRFELAVLIRNQ